MNGIVEILNVGDGDTKLTFDKDNPAERKRAAKIVKDMLDRGYCLLVQIGEDEKGPIYRRATAFDPDTCEYIIATAHDEVIEIGATVQTKKVAKKKVAKKKATRKKKSTARVPAEKTKAVSVARTAGG
jgi:hypothetical protein